MWANPHFSPDSVARVRKGRAGKARRSFRTEAWFDHSEFGADVVTQSSADHYVLVAGGREKCG